jgi:thiamine biosynthesis protein ThiI
MNPTTQGLAAPEMIVVRYGELSLKGKNRAQFEDVLIRNIRAAARRFEGVKVLKKRGRLFVVASGRLLELARRLQDLPGIKSVSPAWGAEPELEAITAVAQRLATDLAASLPAGQRPSFRVRTSRADKRFPLRSTEVDRAVADRVLPLLGDVSVAMREPDLELGIEIRKTRAYLFLQRLPGPGGLPVGTLGRVMCLISGGIDSPVAAYMAMKRGARVHYVTYHSYPFIGEASKKKVVDLVRRLARYQPSSRLFVVPFTEVQTAVRDSAPEAYRTVLYRRFMQRIASRLGRRSRCKALLTGESLAQVASQTLDNMTCIERAADLPVLRPLLTFDKEETIEIARRIGTLDVSVLPEPDCCTVFQPSKPIIHGRLEECEAAEAGLDVVGLVERALAGVERIDIEDEA